MITLMIKLDVARPDHISGADINAICQEVKLKELLFYFGLAMEKATIPIFIVQIIKFYFYFQAGMQAVRENRYIILAKDFEKGYKNNVKKDEQEHEFYK